MKKHTRVSSTIALIWVLLIGWIYLFVAIKVWQVEDPVKIITCEERYIWDSYQWEIKRKDWDYIYLVWYHKLNTICTPYEEEVDEETPLCWSEVRFEWPLDTSNMNCYYDNPKSKLKAFKKRMEAEKKEDKKYYTCNIDSSELIRMYNSCETVACAENRLRTYLEQQCPRANVE